MRVRMRVQITGLRNNVRWPAAGEVVELPDAEGASLCAKGFAEPIVEPEEHVEKRPASKRAEKRA